MQDPQDAPMRPAKEAPDKAKAILNAAFDVFAHYGYRRTAMEDIARAAGVSRPALYQYFRNKEDIMRSLTAAYFDDLNDQLEKALTAPQTPPDAALARAAAVLSGTASLRALQSPHGAEIMEQSSSIAGDIIAAGMARKGQIFAQWLSAEAAAGRIALGAPAPVVASAILSALQGAKTPPVEDIPARMTALARLLGRGLLA